jgi:hypothetical protein
VTTSASAAAITTVRGPHTVIPIVVRSHHHVLVDRKVPKVGYVMGEDVRTQDPRLGGDRYGMQTLYAWHGFRYIIYIY